MKVEGVEIEDAFNHPIVFILVDNHLTALTPHDNYFLTMKEILHLCEINPIENNNSDYLSFEQVLALKGLLDNHDTYKNIAILVEL